MPGPGPLKPYVVVDSGRETTLLLSDRDAKARGLLRTTASAVKKTAAKRVVQPPKTAG